jgi:hypothetical protein
MRYIILKSEVSEGSLVILGLAELNQKASGITPKWLDIREAKTDCANPEKCELLSFEEEETVKELLENTGMIDEGNITFIAVDA